MTATPFMQLYIADYLGDTLHLTTEQHGAYLLILMAMWRADGRLPNDPSKLSRIARVSLRRWHLLADDVMAFFDIEGDTISQKRLLQEREKAASISEKRSASGKLGGTAKALKDKDSTLANAKQLPKHSQIPDTIKKEKTLGASAPERDFFAEFWLAYPRREGPNPKKPAQTVFLRLVAKGKNPEAIIAAAKALAREHPTPSRYVPQAVTWLNQERFADEEPVITGSEFCADDWSSTRILVTRFRNENHADPPRIEHGGKAGYLIPAEWVAISKQGQSGHA